MTDEKSVQVNTSPSPGKLAIEHVESHNKGDPENEEYDNEKAAHQTGNRDYAGAVAKSDPAEIALVRKLDYRILPTLFVMYFLNYVDRTLSLSLFSFFLFFFQTSANIRLQEMR